MGKLVILAAFSGLLLFSGCQTNMVKAFDSLKVGMDKDEVLDTIGGPRAVTRFHGKDRWFILYYHDKIRYEKEIHFLEGRAVYIGEPYEAPPEKQAAYVDKLNEAQDIRTFQELVQSRKESEQEEITLEQKIRKNDKVRTVPQFEPVK